MAMDGNISGSGPSNINEKNQLRETGWRPDSIKIGNNWIPYTNLGPLAGIFSMAGNIHDKTVYDKAPNKTLLDLLGKGTVGWVQTEMNTSFLSGVANLFEAITGGIAPDKYLKDLTVGVVGSLFAPAIYTQTQQMINPEKFNADTIAERLKLKLGLTGDLEPTLNVFGEQKKADLIAGLSPSKIQNDPVVKMLNDAQVIISQPNKQTSYSIPFSDEKKVLSPKEYTQYIEEAGSEIYKQLNDNLDYLNTLNDDDRNKEVQKIVRKIRNDVRSKFLTE
jgi:hypothetical protein